MRRKKQKKKTSYSTKKKFFKIFFLVMFIYFFIVATVFAYSYLTYDSSKTKENSNFIDKAVEKIIAKLPEYTNILLACTDEGEGRTDAIMLVSYNSINNNINVISIPRDTKVSIPSYMWDVMVENFPVIKYDNPNFKKINAIPNYGKEQGIQFLQQYIENMLDIKIDYYAHFNLEGFRYIIDSVGGIEFDVPQKMRHPDPFIKLDPGVQFLDGDKAEQLLRFRGYPQGDLKRIEVQQQFMKVFFEKITSLDTILANPSAYFTTLKKYVDTNVSLSDILKYIPEIKTLSSENVKTYTLPVYPETISGVSFVKVDEENLDDFVYDIFKKSATNSENIKLENSFDKKIVVLNSSYTTGLAKKVEDLLQKNNYNVYEIGDYYDKSNITKIYVEKEGYGKDLEKFFNNIKIIVNDKKTSEYNTEILIIIGSKDDLNENLSNDLNTDLNDYLKEDKNNG